MVIQHSHREDVELADRLVDAEKVLRIDLLDHLAIAEGTYGREEA